MLGRREKHVGKSSGTSARVICVVLHRLAKHLALIACLMIVSSSTGRAAVGQFTVFLIVTIAALLHGTGCFLQRRVFRPPRPARFDR